MNLSAELFSVGAPIDRTGAFVQQLFLVGARQPSSHKALAALDIFSRVLLMMPRWHGAALGYWTSSSNSTRYGWVTFSAPAWVAVWPLEANKLVESSISCHFQIQIVHALPSVIYSKVGCQKSLSSLSKTAFACQTSHRGGWVTFLGRFEVRRRVSLRIPATCNGLWVCNCITIN